MRFRFRTPGTLTAVLSLVLLAVGCDLTSPNEDTYFDTTALSSGRILFAGHATSDPDAVLDLRVMATSGTESPTVMGSGRYDFSGPDAARQRNGTYMISFGRNSVRVLDTWKMGVTEIAGGGTRRAAAFDHSGEGRFAYMKGSETSGFNILLRPSPKGEVTELTTDASSSFGYWTPSWSPDGQWILYAKVPAGATSGTGCELWRVHPDGSGAEKLPITTDEVPTYAIFSPDGIEVFVPADFTSYRISDGSAGTFRHVREMATFLDNIATIKGDYGYEFVGSPVTGPVHEGDTVTAVRHTFPMTALWVAAGDRLYLEALVADNVGDPPHEVLGVALFTYLPDLERMLQITEPMPLSDQRTMNWTVSVMHPILLP